MSYVHFLIANSIHHRKIKSISLTNLETTFGRTFRSTSEHTDMYCTFTPRQGIKTLLILKHNKISCQYYFNLNVPMFKSTCIFFPIRKEPNVRLVRPSTYELRLTFLSCIIYNDYLPGIDSNTNDLNIPVYGLYVLLKWRLVVSTDWKCLTLLQHLAYVRLLLLSFTLFLNSRGKKNALLRVHGDYP